MAIGIQLGSITDEVGTSEFFYAFFSTVSGNLEPSGWGSRFPILLNRLYAGELTQSDAGEALRELSQISSELSELPASKVIWNIEDPSCSPPWGENIADTITDLSNYFVTSTGRDLIFMLREIFEELKNCGGTARLVTM